MKKNLLIVLFILTSLFLSSCQQSEPSSSTESLTSSESSITVDKNESISLTENIEPTENESNKNNLKQPIAEQSKEIKEQNSLSEDKSNNLLENYESNTQYKLDITNDTKMDTFCFDETQNTLTVNDSVLYLDDEIGLINSIYKIVDVNVNDNYKEFVFDVNDPPFGNTLDFYWYDGTDIHYSGKLDGNFETLYTENLYDQDNGEMISIIKSDLIKDAYFYQIYSLNSTHELIPSNFIDSEFYVHPITSKLNKPLNFYKEPTTTSEYIEMSVGYEFTIIGEKNGWLIIQTANDDLYLNGDDMLYYDEGFYLPKLDGVRFTS